MIGAHGPVRHEACGARRALTNPAPSRGFTPAVPYGREDISGSSAGAAVACGDVQRWGAYVRGTTARSCERLDARCVLTARPRRGSVSREENTSPYRTSRIWLSVQLAEDWCGRTSLSMNAVSLLATKASPSSTK